MFFIWIGFGKIVSSITSIWDTSYYYSIKLAEQAVTMLKDTFSADIKLIYIDQAENTTENDYTIKYRCDNLVAATHNAIPIGDTCTQAALIASKLGNELHKAIGGAAFRELSYDSSQEMLVPVCYRNHVDILRIKFNTNQCKFILHKSYRKLEIIDKAGMVLVKPDKNYEIFKSFTNNGTPIYVTTASISD